MHRADELAAALTAVTGQAFDGILYRCIHLEALYGFHRNPPHPAPRPLYSLGAPAHGARFTPPGGMKTLYLAEDHETAFAESNPIHTAIRRRRSAAPSPIPPTVTVSIKAHLDMVLDLTIQSVLDVLGTDRAEILRPWRLQQASGGMAPTQVLGAAIFADGRFQAIRYPSARLARHCCIAIFPDRLVHPAFVEVYDPEGNVYQRIP